MNNEFNTLTEELAENAGVSVETAQTAIAWLEETGVLDHQEIKNVYSN